MYILIGADCVPTERNKELFKSGDVNALIGHELVECLKAASYRIFNLELPLVDNPTPIQKCGPNLIAPSDTVNAYKAMDVDLLTLANNHIFDQGEQGLKSTCATLKENNIAYLGVGNVYEAAKPYFVDFAGKKIGIYACCEHEFSIVTEKCDGANPFDPLESLDHIHDLKRQSDYVIVLYHGGKEHYRYPSPMLQKTCRKIVDKGADLVICQHSHCIGCEEKYQGGTIVYGQGNFLFDFVSNDCWNTGLLVSLDENMSVSYIPIKKQGNGVRLASGEDASQIMKGFNERSEDIKQDGFIEKKYIEFSASMMENYLFTLSGTKKTFWFKVINKLTGERFAARLLRKKYTKQRKLTIQNFIECEAHREVIIQGLKETNDKF